MCRLSHLIKYLLMGKMTPDNNQMITHGTLIKFLKNLFIKFIIRNLLQHCM